MPAHVGRTINVKDTLVALTDTVTDQSTYTTALGTLAKDSSRYEKMEVAFGKLAAGSFLLLDTLAFNIPAKNIISAKFIIGATTADADAGAEILEIFPGADVSNTIVWATGLAHAAVAAATLSYKIEYIRGTGGAGITPASAGSAAQLGKKIKVQITT